MIELSFAGFGIGFEWHWGWYQVPDAELFDFIFFVGPLQFLWVEA